MEKTRFASPGLETSALMSVVHPVMILGAVAYADKDKMGPAKTLRQDNATKTESAYTPDCHPPNR